MAPSGPDQNVGNTTLEKERQDFVPDGKEKPGFASSEVPTIEERIIAEKRPQTPQLSCTTHQSDPKHEDHQPSDRTAKEVNSADAPEAQMMENQEPATNGSSLNNEHRVSFDSKQEKEEQEGSSRQGTIRRQRTSKSKNKWTVPIPRPRVETDGFEDPISDAFWKDTWIASAAYNVRGLFHFHPQWTS